MTPSNWCRIMLLAALLSACATIAATEKQTAPQPESQPAPQTQNGTPSTAQKGKHPGKPCVPVAEIASEPSRNTNQDMCISAHVYEVVELPDGTRFLDVCPADLPDEQCRFTLLSPRADRGDVGDLRRYRNQNIEVRGTVRSMHGRMGIVISHVRQFSGGPEKFRPNPRLLRDFNGQSDRMPVHDPNLSPSGHHRSFMNTRDQEPLPTAKKP
jgi:hypothetical protein